MPLAYEAVLRRCDDDVRLRRERLGNHVRIFGRTQQHGEIGRVLGQLADDFLAVVDAEAHRDAFVAAAELGEETRKKIIAGADDRDIEPAAAYPFQRSERFVGFLDLLERLGSTH